MNELNTELQEDEAILHDITKLFIQLCERRNKKILGVRVAIITYDADAETPEHFLESLEEDMFTFAFEKETLQ